MSRKFIKILSLVFLLTGLTQIYAGTKEFCDSYDPKLTNMQAVEVNQVYPGFPQKLSAEEMKTQSNIWDNYCPACTLPDQTLCQSRPCQKQNITPGSVYAGIQAKGDPWMKMANQEALKSVQNGGGPFGAVILQIDDDSGKIIRYWVNHNHVVEWSDPTAHAEVTTIRTASRQLGVTDLGHINKKDAKLSQPGEWSHCIIYSSAEPCPMCLAAIYWAGIPKLAFSATRFDAAVPGVDFSDDLIYKELALPYAKRKHMQVVHSNMGDGLDAFNYYKRSDVKRYGATSLAPKN